VADIVEIIDFAADDTVPVFRVHDVVFTCVEDIPLGIMQKITQFRELQKKLQETGDMEPILGLMDSLLDEASGPLFRSHVERGLIGVKRITKIIPWIMEEYGLRPTQSSKDSSTGPNDDATGTTSTDGASDKALTLPDSLPETH